MRSALLPLALCAALAAGVARADDDANSNGKAPKHKVTQSQSFVMVEPFYTTIYDAGRPVGMLMVAIGLDIPDSGLRREAETGMPLLRDYYLRNLSNFSATAVRAWQQPDVNEIAARLQRVTDRALHRVGGKVLLAQVAIRVSK
jgi:flagellar basal body-associated protein FliL